MQNFRGQTKSIIVFLKVDNFYSINERWQKVVRAPITINMSLAIGASVIGIRLSNICQFFILSIHLLTCILRLAISLLRSISLLNYFFL